MANYDSGFCEHVYSKWFAVFSSDTKITVKYTLYNR